MKSVIWMGLLAVLAAADKPGTTQTESAVKEVGAAAQPDKVEIVVGKIHQIKLKCNPTTGFNWELKSIDREVAAPTGDMEFKRRRAPRGMVGVGGECVLGIRGVKAGETKAVLVYRRSWEKVEPAETYTAEIRVLPKKKP